MARVQLLITASAIVEIEEDLVDGYSEGDFLEEAENSRQGWMVVNIRPVEWQ